MTNKSKSTNNKTLKSPRKDIINHDGNYAEYLRNKSKTEKSWLAYEAHWNKFVNITIKDENMKIGFDDIPWPIDFYTFIYF